MLTAAIRLGVLAGHGSNIRRADVEALFRSGFQVQDAMTGNRASITQEPVTHATALRRLAQAAAREHPPRFGTGTSARRDHRHDLAVRDVQDSPAPPPKVGPQLDVSGYLGLGRVDQDQYAAGEAPDLCQG